jgi:glycine hydroxymethyltransferase
MADAGHDVAMDIDGSGLAGALREWLPSAAREREREIVARATGRGPAWLGGRIEALTRRNRQIHERDCVNLNPASNVMNPKAEAAMSAGLGCRPSLGYPGAKYETGLEAIEEIEVLAAAVTRQVFGCRYAEVRVGSGALANAYAFLATCAPGDPVIVPPATVGGHVSHHRAGAAGLLGLDVYSFPVDSLCYSVDLDGLAAAARRVRPKLITVGGSLNLAPPPVAEIRAIADEAGARVLFDAAHVSGLIAGGAWPNPLDEGADIVTTSTYKSLGGPPGGLVLTNDADLAQRIDAIAHPGLTANFDAGKTAALAIGLLDWLEHGPAYAAAMLSAAAVLAAALTSLGLPVFTTPAGPAASHEFALDARQWEGGDAAALRLREANILASAIGLPGLPEAAGLRLGTPEIVRWGMTEQDMAELATLVHRALCGDPRSVAADTTRFRRRFTTLHYVRR